MESYRISCVSYLNAQPFREGLALAPPGEAFRWQLDIPSRCAELVINKEVEIGLMPVALIPSVQDAQLITDYCIGADGDVASVLLVANEPIEHLTHVIRDRESRTSVMLAEILFEHWWKRSVQWDTDEGQWKHSLAPGQGAILIGDKALLHRHRFNYVYDLAGVWKSMTGLPFVFACWVANVPVTAAAEQALNKSFARGLKEIPELAKKLAAVFPETDIQEYLTKHIRFQFDEAAQKGLALFFSLAGKKELAIRKATTNH